MVCILESSNYINHYGMIKKTECGVRSAECGVRSAECGVRSAVSKVQNPMKPTTCTCSRFREFISFASFKNRFSSSDRFIFINGFVYTKPWPPLAVGLSFLISLKSNDGRSLVICCGMSRNVGSLKAIPTSENLCLVPRR